MACCGLVRKHWRQINIVLSLISLFLAIFDLSSDWWVFNEYREYGTMQLAAALAAICFIGSALFFLQFYVCIAALAFYCKEPPAGDSESRDDEEEHDVDSAHEGVDVIIDEMKEEQRKLRGDAETVMISTADGASNKMMKIDVVEDKEDDESMTEYQLEEKKISRWEETVSFLQLVLEDIPTVCLIYYAFEAGECEFFKRIYQDAMVAKVALLSSFISALWKGVTSFRYCFSCKFHDLRDAESRLLCCTCRVFRPLAALSLCSFIAYIFFEMWEIRNVPPLSDDVCEHIELARQLY